MAGAEGSITVQEALRTEISDIPQWLLSKEIILLTVKHLTAFQFAANKLQLRNSLNSVVIPMMNKGALKATDWRRERLKMYPPLGLPKDLELDS